MLARIRAAWSAWRASAPVIPDAVWADLLDRHPFLARRSCATQAALRRLSAQFLRDKEFHGADGFLVSDAVALSVAAQACLPVLNLGLDAYDGFVGIVMHPGPVRARREVVDDIGLVHAYEEELVGEAMDGGPIMLCWQEGVEAASPAYNVVVHEFVHLLDLLDGQLDGAPPLPRDQRSAWQATMQAAFDRFDERRACGYPSIIDPYGAQDIGEFFAVTAEAFFTAPDDLQAEQPALYGAYTAFFRQDPARDQAEDQARDRTPTTAD